MKCKFFLYLSVVSKHFSEEKELLELKFSMFVEASYTVKATVVWLSSGSHLNFKHPLIQLAEVIDWAEIYFAPK